MGSYRTYADARYSADVAFAPSQDKDERITQLEDALRCIRTTLHIRVDVSASAKERIMAEIERVLPEAK